MSFAEDLFKLRQKFQDAITKGVISEDNKDIFEATLIQIMNDAEKNKQNCINQAENLRKQASVFDGQASAFASVSSIIYNVIHGFVIIAEKNKEEDILLNSEKNKNELDDSKYNEQNKKKLSKRSS